ncbi:carbohydrate ABC transporter permease [Paenibacillus sp. HB172176]|uniref:carbohydrate ABC transporter permease n=1 Tax=Paenibacillus sp. HB172176 TaxID=2493690 RepID=UPI001438E241|nr:carbohydrate ABC transporter permease [Paenibacillus sp. HB172176]
MKNQHAGYRIFTICNYLFIGLLALAALYPYLNTLAVALNDGNDSMLGGITVYPRMPTLGNFATLLKDSTIIQAMIVSVSQTVLGTLFALIVQFSAGYALTKRRLVGRNAILLFFIVPMFLNGGLIPTYLLYSKLHLLNNFLVYILPSAFSFFNVIIIRTYLYTIPASLEESAKIDGASELSILWRIILPLSRPILATIALWTAVTHWNDWTSTLYFVTSGDLQTLQFKLMQMIKESQMIAQLIQEAQQRGETNLNHIVHVTPEAIRAAQVVITTIPIILVYPFLQKHFIKGVMIGSVKE